MRPWSPIPNALILDARARRIREGRAACEVLALAELLALDAQRAEQERQGVHLPPVAARVVAADFGWHHERLKAALDRYSELGHVFVWIGRGKGTAHSPRIERAFSAQSPRTDSEDERPLSSADRALSAQSPRTFRASSAHPEPDQAPAPSPKAEVPTALSPAPRARARALPQAEIEIERETPLLYPPFPASPDPAEEAIEGEVISVPNSPPGPAQLVLTPPVPLAEVVSEEQQALDVLNRIRGELEPGRSGRRPGTMALEPRVKELRRAARELRQRYGRDWLDVLERTARWVYRQRWCADGEGPANPIDTLLRARHTLRYAEEAMSARAEPAATGALQGDVGFGQFGAKPRRRW